MAPPPPGPSRLLLRPLQFLRDALDADVLPEVAETRAAARDFLHVRFGEPAPFPVGQADALHPAWRWNRQPTDHVRPGTTRFFF